MRNQATPCKLQPHTSNATTTKNMLLQPPGPSSLSSSPSHRVPGAAVISSSRINLLSDRQVVHRPSKQPYHSQRQQQKRQTSSGVGVAAPESQLLQTPGTDSETLGKLGSFLSGTSKMNTCNSRLLMHQQQQKKQEEISEIYHKQMEMSYDNKVFCQGRISGIDDRIVVQPYESSGAQGDLIGKDLIEQSEMLRRSVRKSIAEKKGRKAIEDGGVSAKIKVEQKFSKINEALTSLLQATNNPNESVMPAAPKQKNRRNRKFGSEQGKNNVSINDYDNIFDYKEKCRQNGPNKTHVGIAVTSLDEDRGMGQQAHGAGDQDSKDATISKKIIITQQNKLNSSCKIKINSRYSVQPSNQASC